MLQAPVIDSHAQQHEKSSRSRPRRLLDQKRIRRSVALLGHNRRSAEDHDQAAEYQKECDCEEPAIDTDALSHGLRDSRGETEQREL